MFQPIEHGIDPAKATTAVSEVSSGLLLDQTPQAVEWNHAVPLALLAQDVQYPSTCTGPPSADSWTALHDGWVRTTKMGEPQALKQPLLPARSYRGHSHGQPRTRPVTGEMGSGVLKNTIHTWRLSGVCVSMSKASTVDESVDVGAQANPTGIYPVLHQHHHLRLHHHQFDYRALPPPWLPFSDYNSVGQSTSHSIGRASPTPGLQGSGAQPLPKRTAQSHEPREAKTIASTPNSAEEARPTSREDKQKPQAKPEATCHREATDSSTAPQNRPIVAEGVTAVASGLAAPASLDAEGAVAFAAVKLEAAGAAKTPAATGRRSVFGRRDKCGTCPRSEKQHPTQPTAADDPPPIPSISGCARRFPSDHAPRAGGGHICGSGEWSGRYMTRGASAGVAQRSSRWNLPSSYPLYILPPRFGNSSPENFALHSGTNALPGTASTGISQRVGNTKSTTTRDAKVGVRTAPGKRKSADGSPDSDDLDSWLTGLTWTVPKPERMVLPAAPLDALRSDDRGVRYEDDSVLFSCQHSASSLHELEGDGGEVHARGAEEQEDKYHPHIPAQRNNPQERRQPQEPLHQSPHQPHAQGQQLRPRLQLREDQHRRYEEYLALAQEGQHQQSNGRAEQWVPQDFARKGQATTVQLSGIRNRREGHEEDMAVSGLPIDDPCRSPPMQHPPTARCPDGTWVRDGESTPTSKWYESGDSVSNDTPRVEAVGQSCQARRIFRIPVTNGASDVEAFVRQEDRGLVEGCSSPFAATPELTGGESLRKSDSTAQKAVARQVNSAIFLPRWAHHPPPPPQLNESAESLVPVPERETGGREDLVYAVACSRQEASDPSQSSRQLTTVSTPGVAVGEGPRFGSDQDGPHQEDHMLPSLCARKGCNTPAGYQEVLAADAGDAHSGGTGNVTERMVYWCAAHRSSRSEMGQWAVCSYSGCRLRWCWGHVADTGTMQSSTGRCSYHKEDGMITSREVKSIAEVHDKQETLRTGTRRSKRRRVSPAGP